MTVFVLVHSPSVGPATWEPVAARLRQAGHTALVPSLLDVGDGEPPYWRRVVTAVSAGISELSPEQDITLVMHSNAGLFAPVLVTELTQLVTCCIFADATVPAMTGSTPMAEEAQLPFLRGLADQDGRLRRWTDWWSDEDVAPMFPDPYTREVVTNEQPRLPLRYYMEYVPAPAGWDDRRCGYVIFSTAYEGDADRARALGWPVRTVRGEHLHQIVDPDGVTKAIVELAVEPAEQAGPEY